MNILPTGATQTTPAASPASPASPLEWQPGQRLSGTVLPSTTPGQLTLNIDGTSFTTQTLLTLPVGGRLDLEVLHLGPVPQLRLLNPPASTHRDATLRLLVAQQLPLSPLLANLAAVADGRTAQPLPGPVVELARQLLARLPRAETLRDPGAMRQAITQSGVFLEPQLARAGAATNPNAWQGDFKGGLFQLLQVLQNLSSDASTTPSRLPMQGDHPPLPGTPPQPQATVAASLAQTLDLQQALSELLHDVKGGLARIHLNQLAATASDDTPRSWVIELPVLSGQTADVFHITITPDHNDGVTEGARAWTVNFAFCLSHLGPVHAQLTLARAQVSVRLWAEQLATASLFKTYTAQLYEALTQAGVQVAHVQCQHGAPPKALPHTPPTRGLLDERA